MVKEGVLSLEKPPFFLCNVFLSFDRGCTFSEFLYVIHTRQGHWGGRNKSVSDWGSHSCSSGKRGEQAGRKGQDALGISGWGRDQDE